MSQEHKLNQDYLTKQEFYIRKSEVDKRFDEVDKRFDEVDKRFDEVDKRFDEVDKRFGKVDKRLDKMDKKIDRNFQLTLDIVRQEIRASEERIREEFSGLATKDEILDLKDFIIRQTKEFKEEMAMTRAKADRNEDRIEVLEEHVKI